MLFVWCGLLGGGYWYAWRYDLTPLEAVQRLVDSMTSSALGPLIYLVFYAARPLVLFPASLLTVAAGFVFGPVLGTLLVVLGSNLSASVAYVVGRYFGGRLLDTERAAGVVRRYAQWLRENSFESVLLMRLVYAPYDLVNYLAGSLKVRWTPFILATALGSLPGTVSFVLFGASIEGDFIGKTPRLHPWILGARLRRKPPPLDVPQAPRPEQHESLRKKISVATRFVSIHPRKTIRLPVEWKAGIR